VTQPLTSDFQRKAILVYDELGEFFVHCIVHSITSGASANPNYLVSLLKAFQVCFAPFDDTRDEETRAKLSTSA
jgi:hypothetical protein